MNKDEINNFPLADEDAQDEFQDADGNNHDDQAKNSMKNVNPQRFTHEHSIESIPSAYTNGIESPSASHNCIIVIVENNDINVCFYYST